MRNRITLVAVLVGVIVLTGALVPSPLARVADTEPIVPMGALETAKGKSRGQFAVDAMTGAFIENPVELYEPDTPVDLARRLAP
jgi:hypothetical protein